MIQCYGNKQRLFFNYNFPLKIIKFAERFKRELFVLHSIDGAFFLSFLTYFAQNGAILSLKLILF